MTINSHWEHQLALNELHKLRMIKDTCSPQQNEQYWELLHAVSSFEARFDPVTRLMDII